MTKKEVPFNLALFIIFSSMAAITFFLLDQWPLALAIFFVGYLLAKHSASA